MFREQVRLQFFLNVDKVLAFQTSVGIAFQRRGAAMAEGSLTEPKSSTRYEQVTIIGGGSQFAEV